MITVLNHHDSYPSQYYITSNSDISDLPSDCTVNSQAINIATGDLWIKCVCSTDATKHAWHKFNSTEEVVC